MNRALALLLCGCSFEPSLEGVACSDDRCPSGLECCSGTCRNRCVDTPGADANVDLQDGRDAASDPPLRDVGTDVPMRDAASDPPLRDVGTDVPMPDAASDPPLRDVGTDVPTRDAGSDPPLPDVGTDTGLPDAPHCGNEACDFAETCVDCETDCGECPTCGNGACGAGETCANCAVDCGPCPTCGDDVCNGSEVCGSCPADCGPCGGCPGDMALVPAGPFAMGCGGGCVDAPSGCAPEWDNPRHTVTLSLFCIARTEVTLAAYRAFVVATGRPDPAGTDEFCNWTPAAADREDHPINCVSWDDAMAYCAEAGMTLPTEAQWERAARGAGARTYPWGAAALDCAHANYYSSAAVCVGETAPVCSTPSGNTPDATPLCDFAGNVSEWVRDWFQEDYYCQDWPLNEHNPTGPETERLYRGVRGGGWYSGDDEQSPAYRYVGDPAARNRETGFRCAMTF